MMHINEEMFCQTMEHYEKCNKRVIEQLHLHKIFCFMKHVSLFPYQK